MGMVDSVDTLDLQIYKLEYDFEKNTTPDFEPPPPPQAPLTNYNSTPGNTKGGSITVPLTSCLTGLDWSVLKIKTKIVSYHTADPKPVKQEVNGTVILPPLAFTVHPRVRNGLKVFPQTDRRHFFRQRFLFSNLRWRGLHRDQGPMSQNFLRP
jgi:hypothetical protein